LSPAWDSQCGLDVRSSADTRWLAYPTELAQGGLLVLTGVTAGAMLIALASAGTARWIVSSGLPFFAQPAAPQAIASAAAASPTQTGTPGLPQSTRVESGLRMDGAGVTKSHNNSKRTLQALGGRP
jgi:hypothetical protein